MAVTTERLRALRDALLTGLVERDEAIRLALIASLAGEHLLLVGPPGTAKSLVARRLHMAFKDSTYFERLLTRFTVPEELFGPLSIKGLEEDRYERLTHKYLPSSSIAFLDEIFKANSAILNSLLTLLNEREFDNGTERLKTPLVAVIGASNELPQEEELQALFDRFLLRLHVGPVSVQGFPTLLGLRGQESPVLDEALMLNQDELAQMQQAAEVVHVPEDVVALLCELRDWCTAENIPVSDRRWRKVVKVLQTSALSNGDQEVSIWDCWLLQHCLWNTPEDRQKVHDWFGQKVGISAAMDSSKLTTIVVAWEARLRADQSSRTQMTNEDGLHLFERKDGALTTKTSDVGQKVRDGEPIYLAPEGAYWEPTRSYIQDRRDDGNGYTESEMDKYLYVEVGNRRFRFREWDKRTAYLNDPNNWIKEDHVPVPAMRQTQHKSIYVFDCLRQVRGLRAEVERYAHQLEQRLQATRLRIQRHLWVPSAFAVPAEQTLSLNLDQVKALSDRIAAIEQGYSVLPTEHEIGAAAGSGHQAAQKQSLEREPNAA